MQVGNVVERAMKAAFLRAGVAAAKCSAAPSSRPSLRSAHGRGYVRGTNPPDAAFSHPVRAEARCMEAVEPGRAFAGALLPAPQKKAPTPRHGELDEALCDARKLLVIAEGPAGAGKTYAACRAAARLLLRDPKSRVIIMRPTVAIEGEQHGFLPGDMNDKLRPWMQPVLDHLNHLTSRIIVNGMVTSGRITLEPISHVRGRSFSDAMIIVDELQNATRRQTLALLTRVGQDSRVVLTGDLQQSDLGYDNGLRDLLSRVDRMDDAAVHVTRFGTDDVMRSGFVSMVLRAYADEDHVDRAAELL